MSLPSSSRVEEYKFALVQAGICSTVVMVLCSSHLESPNELYKIRAAERSKPRRAGHVEGARRAGEAVEACRQLGVEVRIIRVSRGDRWRLGVGAAGPAVPSLSFRFFFVVVLRSRSIL